MHVSYFQAQNLSDELIKAYEMKTNALAEHFDEYLKIYNSKLRDDTAFHELLTTKLQVSDIQEMCDTITLGLSKTDCPILVCGNEITLLIFFS